MIKFSIVLLLLIGVCAYADTVTFKGEVSESTIDIAPDQIISTDTVDTVDIIRHADGKTITINYH